MPTPPPKHKVERMTHAQAHARYGMPHEKDHRGAPKLDIEACAADGWRCVNEMIDGAETYFERDT